MGVRISWLTLARNSSLARLAASAASAPLPPGDVLFEDRSRLVLLGDVHPRPDVLEVARSISYGLCQNPDILDGTIRHQEAMFEIHGRPVAECAIEDLSHEGAGRPDEFVGISARRKAWSLGRSQRFDRFRPTSRFLR